MLRKLSAIIIILAYSINAFGESVADLVGTNTYSQINVEQALKFNQTADTAQIKRTHEHSSEHSDCNDNKSSHHCPSCHNGHALIASNIQISPPLSVRKRIPHIDFYLNISLSTPQRPPRA